VVEKETPGAANTGVVKVNSKSNRVRDVTILLGMKVWIILALLISAGVGVSVVDYRNWRNEETKNYGHGPRENLEEALELGSRYINSYAGIRFRYPEGWKMEEKVRDIAVLAESDRPVVLIPRGEVEVVRVESPDGEIWVSVGRTQNEDDVVRILEKEIAAGEAGGVKYIGEREYWNSEREDWGVITWQDGEWIVKKAWAVEGEKTAVVETRYKAVKQDRWLKTVEELIRGVSII